MTVRRRIAILAGLAALAGGGAGAAIAEEPAPPVSGGTVFTDVVGAGPPNLMRITPFTDAEGRFGVRVGLFPTARLAVGEEVATYVDVDADPATGIPFGDEMGADAVVGVAGGGDGPDRPYLARVDALTEELRSAPAPSLTTFRSGSADVVWAMSAAELGVAGRPVVPIVVAAMDTTRFPAVVDWAPDAAGTGGGALAGPIGTVTGPWPRDLTVRPPVPRAPVVLPPRLVSNPGPQRLIIMNATLAGRRGGIVLRAAWQGGKGRVGWRLVLVGRRDGRRLQRVVRGGGSGLHQLSRAVRLPAAWRGVAFRAVFTATDEERTLTRVRMVRFPR